VFPPDGDEHDDPQPLPGGVEGDEGVVGDVGVVGEAPADDVALDCRLPTETVVPPRPVCPPDVPGRDDPGEAAVPPAPAVAAGLGCVAARSCLSVLEEALRTWGLTVTMADGVEGWLTWGHPRNATTALARTNTIAAPARSDPARIRPLLNRQLTPISLAEIFQRLDRRRTGESSPYVT
jgi:hypothetical protein